MSNVYDIGLQRYRDFEIIVGGKDSIPYTKNNFWSKIFKNNMKQKKEKYNNGVLLLPPLPLLL